MGDLHRLSHLLARILRHEAPQRGLDISPEGYVDVTEILQLYEASSFSEDDVKKVANRDSKGRFKLKETGHGKLQIKATQGHTFPLPKLDLTPVSHWTDVRSALHGTRSRNWESIKSQGLSKMKRQYIHFAKAETGVKSGFPPYCDMVVEVDIEKAMRDGIKFFTSENDVVLSEGINGLIPKKYFKKAYYIRSREELRF